MVSFIKFAHCKCKSLMFWSSRLSSVPCQISKSEIVAKFSRLYRKLGSPSKNRMSDVTQQIAK